MLKDLNLFGQRRLGHAQAFGCATEILLLSDGKEEPEVPDQAEIDHVFSIGWAYESLS